MNGKQKVKKALCKIWDEGVVNAAIIYKLSGADYGWYIGRFGEIPQRFGNTVEEVLEEIENRYLEQEKVREEMLASGIYQVSMEII